MTKLEIFSPVDGQVVQIENVQDPVFSQKMLGDGIAIRPALAVISVVSPIDGVIQSVHSSNHAYGIVSDNGVEVLVHIGVDTVNLKGEGFASSMKEGVKVKKGDELAKVDFSLVASKAPSVDVIIVLTNLMGSESVEKVSLESVSALDKLISIK